MYMPKKHETCPDTSRLLLISPCIIDMSRTGTPKYRDSKTNTRKREPSRKKKTLMTARVSMLLK